MTHPAELTIPAIQQELRTLTPAWVGTNAKFYAGDHWQGGEGWSGPRPVPGPGYAQTMDEIRRAFVSKNGIKEIVGRHVAGVVGREPTWGLTMRRPLAEGEEPTPEEQALIKEAEAALTSWWDTRKAHQLIQKAVTTLLLSERAALRLFVPAGQLVDGAVPLGDLATSLERIYLDHPAPAQAAMLTDTASMQEAGVYIYQAARRTVADVSYREGGETVIRTLSGKDAEEVRLDLGGHLLIHELVRPALVSEQVRQHQALLNLALTMLARNVVQAGFLERIITNGLPPGEWVKDPATGKDVFKPVPMKTGAGTTNYVNGLPIEDAEGHITDYTTAGVVHRDPVAVTTFAETRLIAYTGILEEVQQLHALIAGDATASGESRRQAMADFLASLFLTLPEVNRAGRWLLETLLGLASVFSGQPGRFAELRATFECRINPGPLASDELRLIIDLVKEKLLSQESGMGVTGYVEDVAAELARLEAEAERGMQRARQLVGVQQPATATQQPTSQPPTPAPAPPPAQGAES